MTTSKGLASGTPGRHAEVRAAGLLLFRWRSNSGEQVDAADSTANKAPIEFLMLKASYEPYHWTPPKGHVDEGETCVATALRETKEETGLSETALGVLPDFERRLYYEARGKRKETTYFLARLLDSEKVVMLSNEHTEFRWLSPQKAAELGGFPDFRAVVMDAANYVREHLLAKK